MAITGKRVTEVLIVGAGPVGLFLANECARRGLTYRIIEMHSSQSKHSKALAIFPRTLEIFDMAGLVQPFLAAANRVTSISVVAHRRRLAELNFVPEETPYPFIAMVPQNVTERLLAGQLTAIGGGVEYDTRFVSAELHADGATVQIDQHGKTIELDTSFVIGCDGAHSAVRRLIGAPFEGGEYDASFMLADIDTNETLPADQMQICPNESGPLAIFPMSLARRRIVATVDAAEGDAPSLELVQRLLAERGPDGIEAHALRWSSYFRIHHRQVAKLRSGRLFIAGDAAHVHSPFGGQGMNTGLQDAWNLSWKLDLVSRGHGGEVLLDSFTAERRPVIQQVMEGTDLLTKAMATPSRVAQTLRDALIPTLSHVAPLQHAFVNRLSGLGVAYRGSPIVEGAGKRFFDDMVRGGEGIGSRFLLVCGQRDETATRDALLKLPSSLRELLDLRVGRREHTALVRPDGYVAHSGPLRTVTEISSAVRSALGRQIH